MCGAGDTFLAGLTYKIIESASQTGLSGIGTSIEFANKCAGIAVQKRGTYTLTKQDIELL